MSDVMEALSNIQEVMVDINEHFQGGTYIRQDTKLHWLRLLAHARGLLLDAKEAQ